jgi:hypothetical protein
MLATANVDKSVGIWDVRGAAPAQVFNKDMQVGKLHTVSFYESQKMLLGCGGAGGQLGIWELDSEKSIVDTWGGVRDTVGDRVEREPMGEVDFVAEMMKELDKAANNARAAAEGNKGGKGGAGKKGGKKGGKKKAAKAGK